MGRFGDWLKRNTVPIVGLGMIAAGLLILESLDQNYFAQDDNFVQFLPVILRGCRSLWLEGRIPDWLPELALGLPATGSGFYALTYPFTHLSWAVARFLLNDEMKTLEVFFLIHAVGGFLFLYAFLRKRSISPLLALASALSFVFCGYHLVGGRNWYYMLPWILWTPALFYISEEVSWISPMGILVMGVTIGLSLLSGNFQMAVYLFIFFALYQFFSGRIRFKTREDRQKLFGMGSALFLGLAIGFPQLYVQYDFLRGVVRLGPWGEGILRGFWAMLFPYPATHTTVPNSWGNLNTDMGGHIYYAGTTHWLASLCAVFLLGKRKFRHAIFPTIWPWLLLTGLAFVLAGGHSLLLWSWMGKLPLFRAFSNPVKFLHFIAFFSAIAGVIALQRSFDVAVENSTRRNGLLNAVSLITLALLTYHCTQSTTAFSSYADRNYAALPQAMEAQLKKATRLEPHVQRTQAAHFVWSMSHNFPSVYGVRSLRSWDTLAEFTPAWMRLRELVQSDRAQFYRDYGVSHHLFSFENQREFLAPNYEWLRKSGKVVGQWKNFVLWEDLKTTPLAFLESEPNQALSFSTSTNRIEVRHLPHGGSLHVNFLWSRHFHAYANGLPIKTIPDPKGRIQVEVPSSVQEVELIYRAPWGIGLLGASMLLLLAWCFAQLMQSTSLENL